jgi:protein-tyrosine kinase
MSIPKTVLQNALRFLPRRSYITRGQAGPDGVDERVVAHTDRTSMIAEQYHALQTHLYALMNDKIMKTIVITSGQPEEGKTLTACNLAVSMASDKHKKILLVDSDLRKPEVHTLMGIGRSPGFSDVLTGRQIAADILRSPVIDNLFVLPAGNEVTDISELLRRQGTKDVLDSLKSSFDHIIIDTPPVMPVTDSRILGAICDAVLLVARSESTPKKLIKDVFSMLDAANARPVGAILTYYRVPFHNYAAYYPYYSSCPER